MLPASRAFDLDYRLTAQSVATGYDPASIITAVNDNRPTADTALNPGVEAC